MKQIEDLQKRWRDSIRFRGLHAAMSLGKNGLELGAGTVLAKRNHDGALALDGEEARLLTLLAVAHGQPVKPSVLHAIRNASKHARAGDECMAAMHIALAVPALGNPSESARRIFIADGLMAEGVSPREIWTALGFDPAPLDELDKLFNPDQPRVPAGNPEGGEWTGESPDSGAEVPEAIAARIATQEAADTALGAAERAWWESIIEIAPRLAGPLAFLGALLYSTPAGGERRGGKVPGHADLYWTEDEGLLTITRKDGQLVLQATRGRNGTFRLFKPRAVGRLLNEHSLVDPETLPLDDPRSSQRDDEPRMCPEPPRPDKPQWTARSWRYTLYMKARVNEPPTPPGFAYQLRNPYANGDVVNYDDCERDSHISTMDEFKGPGYARLLRSENPRDRITYRWLNQATRQVEASGGRPVRWYFAEKPALEFARQLFSAHAILERIELVYAPMPENER